MGAWFPLDVPWSTAVGFVVTLAALSMLAEGCGSAPGGRVAQLGSPTASRSSNSQMLAYARCMRTHGVPTFPDPNGSGQIAKNTVVNAQKDDPSRFDSADAACRHLAPNGGNGETPAEITQDWQHFRQFAQCMRRHGVPNWPDPTSRSATDRRPKFDIKAAGLFPFTPQIRAKVDRCTPLLQMGAVPAAG